MSASLSFPMIAANRQAASSADRQGARRLGGALFSVAAHAGALAALSLAVLAPLRQAAPPTAVSLVFVAPAPTPSPPAPPVTQTVVAQQTVPASAPEPLQIAAPLKPPVPVQVLSVAKMRRPPAPAKTPAVPVQETTPRNTAPAPIQTETAPPAAVDVAGLKTLIQRAVQDAAIYPQRARLLHRQGRAQIRFDYAGGAVAGVALAQSSQSPMLDQAALDAVRRAAYPKAAAQLRLALVVWVNFGVAAE